MSFPYHATFSGDTEFSAPVHTCRYCKQQGLAWGPYRAGRRLFTGDGRLHDCRTPPTGRCHCEAFGDLVIPVRFYDEREYRPWDYRGSAAERRSE